MRKRKHPLCRPPQSHAPTMRLRPHDRRWVRDNGDPGLAFVQPTPDEDSAIVYVANCACKNFLDCPLSHALAYAGDRYATATVIRRRAVRATHKKTARIARKRTRK